MTTMNSILVSSVRSNKSDNNVWAVYVQGQESKKSYCKSPAKAMRFAFYLKKLTGCRIADNSLAVLSLEIKRRKEAAQAAEQKAASEQVDEAVIEFVDDNSAEDVPAVEGKKPKAAPKKRKSSKKTKKEVAA